MPTAKRFRRLGESPYPHEEEALQYLEGLLPKHDPYQGWALLELPDSSTGRLLEIDALVIGYGAIYLIEIKSHPGRITGDATDWWWEPADDPGRKVWVDPPLRLANLKAKILKSRLAPHVRDMPWIQPLVFLSAAEPDLRADGRLAVVTRDELRDAIVKHQFPGVSPSWQNRRLNAPQVQAVVRALTEKVGLRERKGRTLAGDYELLELIDEGPGYQDRRAVHQANARIEARARTYLVPQQTSVERRQQLLRAAARESQLLYEVRDHPSVLTWQGYAPDAPLGPTVLFEPFEDAAPLPAFLRSAEPTYDERLEILSQLARALAYCHRREILHGALSPEAVLVRRAEGRIEVRLTNFQLGQSHDVEATTHWSALASAPWFLYQAPELRLGNTRDARADIYSLGSVAYFLFTGRPPAEDLAELHAKLDRDQALDVLLVDPTIPKAIADAIDFATQAHRPNRADDAGAWLELLLDELTSPDHEVPDVDIDPLLAKREDRLSDLVVLGVLGQGASARVLHVRRDSDERELALKVSLSADHDERLRAEAAVLAKMRHPRIVQLYEERTIAGRACLLLSLAGGDTLKRHLDVEGTVSLDFASRYGDDLLSALEHLEDDVRITHRDIKPANLGVGTSGKTAHHLTLFDFSLADVPRTELGVGTSAYRDPFLPARGAWDAAADRWSAAITLHEMLTGVRPTFGSAHDPDARLALAAERFDAAVRAPLVAFFERALHRDVERRFATAREMRHAWVAAFEAPSRQPSALVDSSAEPLTDDEVKSIAPDTPVMALPLTFRARNGLDRAGLLTAKDLFSLPDNRLSAVRGVGTSVAREILEFRDRWAALLGTASLDAEAEPFDPSYAGEDVPLSQVELDPRFATALEDAALESLGAIARAPRAHVEALASRAGASVEPLRALLARETARRAPALPPSIEALLAELLPKRLKRAAYVEALYGLTPPFEGRLDVSAREVAEHVGKSTANLYLGIGALRESWAEHPWLGELELRVDALLDRAGGALPLSRAADSLLAVLPHDTSAPSELRRARAAALLRVVGEVHKEELDGVRVARLGQGRLWLLASQDYTETLRRLGAAADELAAHDPLASPAQVQAKLESVARGTPLESFTPAQLVENAAAASDGAACSALLEIYPRGLPSKRALELSASLLTSSAGINRRGEGGLTPDDVRHKVAARYPAAEPLPGRPALDALLSPLRLVWSPSDGRYLREGDRAGGMTTTVDSTTYVTEPTSVASPTVSVPAPRPHRRPRLEPPSVSDEEVARLEIGKRLRVTLEQKALRILSVNPAYLLEATRALEAHLGLEARPLDSLLLAAMTEEMKSLRIRPEVVHAADRAGPGSPGWTRLVALMERAEARVQADLLAEPGPLLLTRPGLLARYGLTRLLQALVDRANEGEAEATLLIVPARDRGGIPRIEAVHPIPGILQPQVLRIPSTFAEA